MNFKKNKHRTKEFSKHLFRVFMLLALAGFVVFASYLPFSRNVADRKFEGVVIEKWIDVSETEEGSRLYPRIRVKTDNQEKIKLTLDSKLYERLKIGDRLRHEKGEIEIRK